MWRQVDNTDKKILFGCEGLCYIISTRLKSMKRRWRKLIRRLWSTSWGGCYEVLIPFSHCTPFSPFSTPPSNPNFSSSSPPQLHPLFLFPLPSHSSPKNANTIDLHGLYVEEAIEELEKKLKNMKGGTCIFLTHIVMQGCWLPLFLIITHQHLLSDHLTPLAAVVMIIAESVFSALLVNLKL